MDETEAKPEYSPWQSQKHLKQENDISK